MPSAWHQTQGVSLHIMIAFAAPARAQYEPTFPGCPKCGVAGYVDVPGAAATVSNADLLAFRAAVEGWGFECVSGNPVDRVDIYVEDDVQHDFWHPVKQAANTQGGSNPRPDVEAVFASACQAIEGQWTGFVRWLDQPLPLGAHRFLFVLWKGPYHTQTQGPNALIKTLNVVP
jgi:hypothetical protein